MKKKGDLSMSFGMIFSIIMIIVILGVAFYAISYFLNLQKCTGVGLFHDDFQKKVDESWASELISVENSLAIPGGVEYVCFGDLKNVREMDDSIEEIFNEIKNFASPHQETTTNMFIYPMDNSCGMGYKSMQRLEIPNEFSCFENRNGKITFRLTKGSEDSFVRISN